MSTARMFIGLDLSADAKINIDSWRQRHLHGLNDSPVPMENFHITLSFLGNVQRTQMPQLEQELEAIQGHFIETKTTELGCFQKAKILYLGTHLTPELSDLAEQCRKINRRLGLPQHHSKFVPHITIFRKHRMPFEFNQEVLTQTLKFSQFHLFESVSRAETGKPPHYAKRLSYDLIPTLKR